MILIVYIKNKNHHNSNDNNDNVNANTNTNTNTNNNNNNNKCHYKQGEKMSQYIEIQQGKIFKQIIMTPQHYPPTFLPHFTVLNPPEKQLYK